MKHFKKTLLTLLVVLLVSMSGCSSSTSNKADILTLKKSEEGRTKVSVLVKYAFSINNFEKIVEEKFPDIDLVQVGNYTSDTTLAKEYEARLKNDDLTDIVMTWPLNVGEEYWKDRLIDLSGYEFTSKYNTSMLDTIATEDDNLYYLPGPADIRGIVYNKTLFKEKGWKVPTNYNEFIALCKTIKESGIAPFQLSLGNREVLDTSFIAFNYGNAYSKPKDILWLDAYNEGKGSFLDHFKDALTTYDELVKEGVLDKSYLNLHYQDTQLNLFTRKTAMTEDSSLLTHQGKAVADSNDEFALMPFFNKNPQNDWVRIYMTCYIGLNKHLLEDENKETYEKVLKLMNYISTEEGQTALASDSGSMYSSLKNMETAKTKEIENIVDVLSQGRYGVFPTLERSQDAFRDALTGMLKGTMNVQEAAAYIDKHNQGQQNNEKQDIYGKATEDFTFIDTGSYVSDVLKEECKSNIALFLDNGKDGLYNGKGISAKFYKGNIGAEDIRRVFPDLKHGETGELWNITMTGENLIKTLEYALEVDNNTNWFYYFSGLKVTFNPYAKQGKRVTSITLANGDKLDKKKVYSVAVMEDSVPEKYILSCEKTGVLIQDLLKDTITKQKVISPANDQRFIIEE